MFFIGKKGFTLFELIITIAIFSILCTLALPHFHQYMALQERTKTVNTLMNSIKTAKNIANLQRQNIVICPSQSLLQCQNNQWNTGFIVFIDNNKNRRVDTSETIIRTEQQQLKYGNLDWRGALHLPSLSFKAENGLPLGSNGTFYYCSIQSQDHFILVMSKMGQTRTESFNTCNYTHESIITFSAFLSSKFAYTA